MVKDGDTIGIGGFSMKRHPMALVKELIRQSKKESGTSWVEQFYRF